MSNVALITTPFRRNGSRTRDRMMRYVGQLQPSRIWRSYDREPDYPWVAGSMVINGVVTFYADDPDARYMPPPYNLRAVLMFPQLLKTGAKP